VTFGACALLAAGCGPQRQDANEPRGNYPVEVAASFPSSQRLAKPAIFSVRVRNAGTKTMPNVAVTVTSKGKGTSAEAFAQTNQQVGLQSRSRPVWIVDRGPKGGETAFANTWAVGSLGAGRSTTIQWRVTPVKPGKFGISYRVAAGLYGKARAVLQGGGIPKGSFDVSITNAPRQSRVAGNGAIVEGGGSKP
jgi:hypothetical protein